MSSFDARILAVQGDDVSRSTIIHTLRRARFEVMEASTGRDALRLTREQRPDAVVLDACLADGPGYDVCRAIRADGELHDVAILSVEARDRVHALEQGADACVLRPVDPHELVATVRALLRARRGDGAARPARAGAHLELMRVLGAAPVALALIDRELGCTWCNRRFLALGGRTSRDEHVMTLGELLPPATARALELELRRVLDTGFEVMVGLPVKDLADHVWRAHLVPVGPGGGDGVVCSIMEPLDARTWALHQQVGARDALIATANHALRDPLTAALLRITSLEGLLRAGRLDEARERLAAAATQVEDLARKLDAYLDPGLVGPLVPEDDVDLSRVVAASLARVRPAADAGRCELRVKVSGPTTGRWDAARLEHVVWRLLEDAVRHAPGSPIDVELAGSTHGVRLVVRDHGRGIPEPLRELVFRPTRRGQSPEIGGRGFGLWLAREGIDAHGGSIRLEGEGTTFVVELPRGLDPAGPLPRGR